ncbi:metalloregulator ArsR/SmtB family transcription factor [Gillisia sp. M10.2A]|uniref:Metalloregulator ArsR/SmtB family transcription factor n=1 Tax=Gillisia lutea TaxID=2909668 RepID=A0ABS9EFN8_9FLAO|nr:metalloregulator ArsR/SmtB family transcription factor [Gillisia lutea]MCF4101672.1 metalloregulator ArsR/SmtB family transcription factor [Gillisia lutea]
MGLTKSEMFTEEQNEIAQIAKVMGHPARIAILEQILKAESCICGDLVSEIGLAQPTISQHLKELKNTGLIKGDIDGTRVCYCINEERWEQVRSILLNFMDKRTKSTNECC